MVFSFAPVERLTGEVIIAIDSGEFFYCFLSRRHHHRFTIRSLSQEGKWVVTRYSTIDI